MKDFCLTTGSGFEGLGGTPLHKPPLYNDLGVAHPESGSSSAWFRLIGVWKCRKTSRSEGENQQQTQPTYGISAEIWTWATLVGGECSHHCTIPGLKKCEGLVPMSDFWSHVNFCSKTNLLQCFLASLPLHPPHPICGTLFRIKLFWSCVETYMCSKKLSDPWYW